MTDEPVLGTCLSPQVDALEPHPKGAMCEHWRPLPVQTDEPPTGIQRYEPIRPDLVEHQKLWICHWCGCAVYDRDQHGLACVPSAAYYQSQEGR